MRKRLAAAFALTLISSLAAAQAPTPFLPIPDRPGGLTGPGTGTNVGSGRKHTALRRADGQPTDEVLMRISAQCHRAGRSDPEAIKTNCFYIDQSIKARAAEAGAGEAIKARAAELNGGQ